MSRRPVRGSVCAEKMPLCCVPNPRKWAKTGRTCSLCGDGGPGGHVGSVTVKHVLRTGVSRHTTMAAPNPAAIPSGKAPLTSRTHLTPAS